MSNPRTMVVALALALIPLGCTPKIGDSCRRSRDCSIQGDRVCDLSYRVDNDGRPTPRGRGECTIEGCGRNSCPDEAACVKVYGSDFLSIACDPEREDRASVGRNGQTLPPLDDCMPNEVCLPEGLCADEITARNSCRRKCSDDGDCRAGYTCTRTGVGGIYRAPNLDDPSDDAQTRICVPNPP